ncbi:MAG: hypothetical protein AB7L09_02710 [Nitrospira sp.]
MTKRNLTTLESFVLVDNLQAVHHNIEDAIKRLGLDPSTSWKEAFSQVGQIIPPINGVIAKLWEQSEAAFKMVVEPKVSRTGIIPGKYKDESAEFELSDEEWAIVDQWKGVYQNVEPDFYASMILKDT